MCIDDDGQYAMMKKRRRGKKADKGKD